MLLILFKSTLMLTMHRKSLKKFKDTTRFFRMISKEQMEEQKKDLWLTEVACGSNNPVAFSSFIDDLMNPSTGLTNRDNYPYLSHVSWFSAYSFSAFTIDGNVLHQNESWTSTLFSPFGNISKIGEKFFSYC